MPTIHDVILSTLNFPEEELALYPNSNHPILRIYHYVHSGQWRWNQNLLSQLDLTSPPVNSEPWMFYLSIHLTGIPAHEYTVKIGRKFLCNPAKHQRWKPAPIRVDPSLNSAHIWNHLASPFLPSKYWIQIWHCMLHGQYTNNVTSHFIPEQSSTCSLCSSDQEDVDHCFRTCPSAVNPFWKEILLLIIRTVPTIPKSHFWSGLQLPGIHQEVSLLAWAVGIFTIYQCHTEQIFDDRLVTSQHLFALWRHEFLGVISFNRSQAYRKNKGQILDAKWESIRSRL